MAVSQRSQCLTDNTVGGAEHHNPKGSISIMQGKDIINDTIQYRPWTEEERQQFHDNYVITPRYVAPGYEEPEVMHNLRLREQSLILEHNTWNEWWDAVCARRVNWPEWHAYLEWNQEEARKAAARSRASQKGWETRRRKEMLGDDPDSLHALQRRFIALNKAERALRAAGLRAEANYLDDRARALGRLTVPVTIKCIQCGAPMVLEYQVSTPGSPSGGLCADCNKRLNEAVSK